MYYGDEKIRQMARSILPSKARKSARSRKTAIKRAHRHTMNHIVRTHWEDLPDDFDNQDTPNLSGVVSDRRDADKLNHFMKWAESLTENMPRECRISKMRAILPDGLIGEHAVSHLRGRSHFILEEDPYWNWRPDYARAEEARHNKRRHTLTEIVHSGWGHTLINKVLRPYPIVYRNVELPPVPKLNGLHDIEEYLTNLYAGSIGKVVDNPPQKLRVSYVASLDRFLENWRNCYGSENEMYNLYWRDRR